MSRRGSLKKKWVRDYTRNASPRKEAKIFFWHQEANCDCVFQDLPLCDFRIPRQKEFDRHLSLLFENFKSTSEIPYPLATWREYLLLMSPEGFFVAGRMSSTFVFTLWTHTRTFAGSGKFVLPPSPKPVINTQRRSYYIWVLKSAITIYTWTNPNEHKKQKKTF